MTNSTRSSARSSGWHSTRSTASSRGPVINGPVIIENATFLNPGGDVGVTVPGGGNTSSIPPSALSTSSSRRGPLSERNLAIANGNPQTLPPAPPTLAPSNTDTNNSRALVPSPANVFNSPNGSVRSATINPNDSTSQVGTRRSGATAAAAAAAGATAGAEAAVFDVAFNAAREAIGSARGSAGGSGNGAGASARGSERSAGASSRRSSRRGCGGGSPLAGNELVRSPGGAGSERSGRSTGSRASRESGGTWGRSSSSTHRHRSRAFFHKRVVYEEVVPIVPTVPIVPVVYRGFRPCPHCHFVRMGRCGCCHGH